MKRRQLSAIFRQSQRALGYGLAMMAIFVASTVVVATSMQMMMGPISAAYLGAASKDNIAANQLAYAGLKAVIADLQVKYDSGTAITTGYSYSSSSAPTTVNMPTSPDAMSTVNKTVGSYTGAVLAVNGNSVLIGVTATVGIGNYTLKKLVFLTHNPYTLDNITGYTAAYGLRKLKSSYAGKAIRVRRGSDNTEQDIGFEPSGGLDLAGLRNFLEGGSSYAKPLDLVTGAVAAYSTRKLRQAYTGSAIRVRRSSDSTEQDIGFDAAGNLDVYSLMSFVGTGSAYVKTWYDQSGNGYNAIQANTTYQPRIVNAGVIDTLNGHPAIRSLGAQVMMASNANIIAGTGGWHYFTVLGDYGSVNGSYYMDRYYAVSGNPIASLMNQSGKFTYQVRTDAGTLYTIPGATAMPTDGTPVVIDYLRNRGSYYAMYYNGLINVRWPDVDGNTTPQGSTIFAHNYTALGFANYSANAAIGELIIYSTNLTTANRQKLENEQARYWQVNMIDPGFAKPVDSVAGASAAFGLRKLKAAYAGSAIRVRRSSDNTEKDIGFDTLANLDVPTLMNFVGTDSAYVKTWYDQSGNGYDASQTTAANQPRIVNAGVLDTQAGRPALYFNGTATYMTTGTTMSITGTGATALAVVNMDSATPAYGRVMSGKANGDANDDASTTSACFFCRNNGSGVISGFRQNASQGSITVSGVYGQVAQMTALYDGTNNTLRLNGVAGTSVASSGNFGINQLWIGADPGLAANRRWKGYQSELILYPTALTAASPTDNLQTVEANQMAYFNVSDAKAAGTGYVTKWYDQSGNGYDLSQTTPLLQPIIRWDNQTNRPSIYFNGVTTFLKSPTTLSITGNTLTAFAVGKMYSTTPAYGRLFSGKDNTVADDSSAVTSACIMITNGATAKVAGWRTGPSAKSAATVTLGKMFQATSIYDGTNHTMRVNGLAATAVASSGNFSINQLWVGTAPTTFFNEFWNGTISEVILYPSTLTTTQMQIIEKGQHTFYGTP